MANYKRITDIEVMEEVSENSMALVNENGVLKQVPCGKGFGGGTAAIIRYTGSGVEGVMKDESSEPSFNCDMTFSEVVQIIESGEPLDIIVISNTNGAPMTNRVVSMVYTTTYFFCPTIMMQIIEPGGNGQIYGSCLYWTEEYGITLNEPSSGEAE